MTEEFVPLFDPDAAGQHALKTLRHWGQGKKLVHVPEVEHNRDPAEMTTLELVELLEEFIPAYQLSPT